MAKIRVTKKFHFEMGHALHNYDGLCRNIHGHTYNMEVTLLGEIREEKGHPKDGMVIDFGKLKKLVKDKIVNVYDHSLVVSRIYADKNQEHLLKATERLIVHDFQPTSENMCVYFAGVIQQELPEDVSLYSIRLYETATSYAEWFAEDNK
ncbi:6-pyruvoyl trahydropterin synthase family protein [Draconibacterium sediminis]|uniref:6-carboxy-5,6,7,8-tetrahydropterin synthase n=1 Tax=Draconibacterium sediminis TaxID=1544798 RepID=A0A0D8J7L6_9BACT|nr:6-carboxytetrahydropterin synthase [Draconibacterium sediminis]KJF42872.1 6-pyruvoyl tetrahydropterin synthase [Draconibacterium sediminis]